MDTSAELERLQRELEEARRQLVDAYPMTSLGRLLAGVVHEINTPIGSIVSNNEVLSKSLEMIRSKVEESVAAGQPAPKKVVEMLGTLAGLAAVDKMACDRILSVIRGLKTQARVEEGELRRVSLTELVEGTLKLAQCEYKRRATVETHFAELPPVECYPNLLSQVVLNLVVNAAQAIEAQGTIRVETRLAGEYAEIEIADSGKGMTPEQQAKIFQAGFTTKPPGVGTGLGLSISHDIVVEKHKGAIEFESELGRGTTFRVRIPVSQPKA